MAYFLGLLRKEQKLMNQWQQEVRSDATYFYEYLYDLLDFPFLLAPQSYKIIAVERFVFCIF